MEFGIVSLDDFFEGLFELLQFIPFLCFCIFSFGVILLLVVLSFKSKEHKVLLLRIPLYTLLATCIGTLSSISFYFLTDSAREPYPAEVSAYCEKYYKQCTELGFHLSQRFENRERYCEQECITSGRLRRGGVGYKSVPDTYMYREYRNEPSEN